jgi:choline dehydrogenase-like flavoprotein
VNTPQEHAQVVVIGAGAGGAAVSFRLAELGVQGVVCLEQGDWLDRSQLPKTSLDWEARGKRSWSANPSNRNWLADYPVRTVGPQTVDINMYNAVGGSTIGFYGNYWRLAPSDFRRRTLDNVGIDWPLSYWDLATYYDRNEEILGVAGLRGDPTAPDRPAPPSPPAPLGTPGSKLVQGYEKLGWHWWPTDQAIVTKDHSGRAACTNRGFCAFGCPQSSLSTVDVSYWPLAIALGVELRPKSRVRELIQGRDGRISEVRYVDATGTLRRISAAIVVLAAGGYGTPRLLLMSQAHRGGELANSSGQVGRNLMLHIQTLAVGTFSEAVDGWQGTLGGTVATREFYESDPGRGYSGGFIISGGRGIAPLSTAEWLPWGAPHHGLVATRLNHQIGAFACGDDLPEFRNRVQLDSESVDSDGLPGITVDYTMGENSKRMGVAIQRRLHELFAAAGAESVTDFGFDSLRGWHPLGTARMGSDPGDSVVDADLRTHDAHNLYIADGSVFATAGGVNPANTVQALALRCADRIFDAWPKLAG